MAGQRKNIMEIRSLIALKRKGLSNRKIAALLKVNRKTVDGYVRRFTELELDYNALLDLCEADLVELFTENSQREKERYETLAAGFSQIEKELTRPGCTLQVLWQGYISKDSQGYQYTQFTYHYRKWKGLQKTSGRLEHKAGERLFVDFCGKKLWYVDRQSGERKEVEVFIGILPCSQYTYVKAVHSQKREDFIDCLDSCLRWMGGVPQAIVSDNLKAAVSQGSKYAPEINKTLIDFALHYDCAVDPARPHHPQDKSLVERSVTLVYQRIFYPLDKFTFFSLADLNEAIWELLSLYNDYLFSHGGGSRRSYFVELEEIQLQPLPVDSYSLRYYRRAKVQKIAHVYHSEDKNYYSVPCRFIGLNVELQYNRDRVEIFYNHERIAAHQRSYKPGHYTTVKDHMPSTHQFYQDWSPEYFATRAEKIGPSTQQYILLLINQYDYPEIGYKQALGILSLVKLYDVKRIENACMRGLSFHKATYRTIENILKNGMDFLTQDPVQNLAIPAHIDVRGPQNYH